MKLIRSNVDQKQMEKELNIVIDDSSIFTLIEKGFDPVEDCINIIFSTYNPTNIKEMMNKSGYFKTQTEHIVGKTEQGLELISIKDIIYIEGINNDTYFHTKDKEYSIKDKLYELEIKLQDKLFVRISKSYIVSIAHINKIKPTFNGKLMLILNNNVQLEVSRHYLSDFRKVLGM